VSEEPAKAGNTLGVAAIVVGVVVVAIVAIVGVLASLAIHGFRSYIARAKAAEGQNGARQLAEGIRSCAGKLGGGLPETTRAVPATLAEVSGKKYQSRPEDWSDRAYTCAAFSLTAPQYFQYRWEIVSPSSGRAITQADLDGDGTAELRFEVLVTCTGDTCTTGPLITK